MDYISMLFKYRKKKLIRFLKEWNCYINFIQYAVNNTKYGFNSSNNIDELVNYSIGRRFENSFYDTEIFNAFDWNYTLEGYDFWNYINHRWIKIANVETYDMNNIMKSIK